jgi:hypothetical protein
MEDPMLRFGGEDEAAALDPSVTRNVVGADPIEAADRGLRNIDRAMDMLIPATTQRGRDYTRLASMYEALVAHRYRQLDAVAKIVGGVEETRSLAGRGGVPFEPVPPQRQRLAVAFLVERGFTTPVRLLDPEVLRRIAVAGGSDPLQGSNVKLLSRLLDPGVFQRMAEAGELAPKSTAYGGRELLDDLNHGLFNELDAPHPKIEFYRRELQRNYVLLLSSLAGGRANAPSSSTSLEERFEGRLALSLTDADRQRARLLSSPLADVGMEYRSIKQRPSEFRAGMRAGARDLLKQIERAEKKVQDRTTALHLADLRSELDAIP